MPANIKKFFTPLSASKSGPRGGGDKAAGADHVRKAHEHAGTSATAAQQQQQQRQSAADDAVVIIDDSDASQDENADPEVGWQPICLLRVLASRGRCSPLAHVHGRGGATMFLRLDLRCPPSALTRAHFLHTFTFSAQPM